MTTMQKQCDNATFTGRVLRVGFIKEVSVRGRPCFRGPLVLERELIIFVVLHRLCPQATANNWLVVPFLGILKPSSGVCRLLHWTTFKRGQSRLFCHHTFWIENCLARWETRTQQNTWTQGQSLAQTPW